MAVGSEWIEPNPSEKGIRWKRAGLVLAVALLIFGTGLVVGTHFAAEEVGEREGAVPATGQAGADGDLGRVSAGSAMTEAGAAAAAAGFLRIASGSLDVDGGEYVDAMVNMAAPEWKSRAEETGRNAADFFRGRYGTGGNLFAAPVAVKVTDFASGTARVEMWSVSVASGPKRPAGEQIWALITLDMRWVDGDWRIAREETTGYPAPAFIEGIRPSSVKSVVTEFGAND